MVFFDEKNGQFKSRCRKDNENSETIINETAGPSQRSDFEDLPQGLK
jgi:hypothetical protein